MRVTIDAVPLLVRSAGVKTYLYYWTRHLSREAHGTEIRLFPFLGEPGKPGALDHQDSLASPWLTHASLGLLFLLNRIPNNAIDWIDSKIDVFHTAKLLHPPRRAKLTATAHDFTCWMLPETHSPANVAADRAFGERILNRVDGLIVASEATRVDALRFLKLPPEKMRVIHHGVADMFFRATPADADAVRSRLGLGRPYLLFVGTIEPRKNVDLLLDAYQGLPPSIREEFELVLAGPPGWAPHATMARLRQLSGGMRYLGYVAEQDMAGLFAGATALVYPSLYEGFGFPVAQAMATGTPVITSGVSSLPEIAGGAAVLVDPRSERELREAMRNLLTSPGRRAELSELGRANALRFSWTESARQSLRFFEDVAG